MPGGRPFFGGALGHFAFSFRPASGQPTPSLHIPPSHHKTQTRQRLESALAWMGDHPKRGAALFALAEAVAVVALAPASLFAMAAGALFGPVAGGALSWAGLAAGQTAAFAVGRTLFRDRVRAWLAAAPPRWAAIDAAVGKGGWRLAALLRLSPAVPWNLLNYGLSATSLATLPYALASAAAVAPWCALFAYLGSLARSLADVLDGSAGPGGPAAAAMVAAGGALVVAAVWYVAAISKRTVEESLRGAAPGAAALAEELEGLDPLAAVEGGDGGGASPAPPPTEVQMAGLAATSRA